MLALFDALRLHLIAELPALPKISLALPGTETSAVSIRFMPSPDGERYLDRSRILNIQFQVLTKGKDGAGNAAALTNLTNIADALELINGELSVTGYDFLFCETYTEPNFIEKNDAGEYLYTALFRCQLIKRG